MDFSSFSCNKREEQNSNNSPLLYATSLNNLFLIDKLDDNEHSVFLARINCCHLIIVKLVSSLNIF